MNYGFNHIGTIYDKVPCMCGSPVPWSAIILRYKQSAEIIANVKCLAEKYTSV